LSVNRKPFVQLGPLRTVILLVSRKVAISIRIEIMWIHHLEKRNPDICLESKF